MTSIDVLESSHCFPKLISIEEKWSGLALVLLFCMHSFSEMFIEKNSIGIEDLEMKPNDFVFD